MVHLGTVAVGEESSKQIGLANVGEAKLAATFGSTDPAFHLSDGAATIESGEHFDLLVTFHPTEPGDFVATIAIASNDPDEPMREIEVFGTATDDAGEGGGTPAEVTPGDGCGCKIADAGSQGAPITAALLAGAALLRRRRRAR
jgi:MYXO-CTERM domain-containing protein